jgi:hypothetical protein
MRRAPFALLASFALLWAAAPARAEDPPVKTPAQTLVGELEAAKAAKDGAKWMEGLKRVGTLYPDAAEADKKLLIQAAGAGLKAKDESVQGAALDALVATKDGDGAWKAGLKSELPEEKADVAKSFSIRVVNALKELHPEGAVASLLTLLQKAKDPKVSTQALQALGAYERSKQRAMILEEVIKVVRNTMPSRSSTKNASVTPKWTEMEPHVVASLNALTGHSISDLGTWFKFYDEDGKKSPKVLFKNAL